jgi:tellurite resistance protein
MPWNSNPAMQALRLTYNAAVAAHASCSRALTEATLRGGQASPELIEAEAKAKARLAEAREMLHTAMAVAMAQGGTTDSELPNP